MRPIFTLLIALLAGGSASAQAERYELGQRLKAFEKQWDKTTDEKVRKKAAEGLPKLTALFFTGQFGEAGRTLDEARWILEGKEPSADEKWAQSLYAVPDTRYSAGEREASFVTIKAFYTVKSAMPKNLTVRLNGARPIGVDALPTRDGIVIPNKGTDYTLQVQIWLGQLRYLVVVRLMLLVWILVMANNQPYLAKLQLDSLRSITSMQLLVHIRY